MSNLWDWDPKNSKPYVMPQGISKAEQHEHYSWENQWQQEILPQAKIDSILDKAMEEVTIRDGDREIRMGYEDINAILLLIETLKEMGDDNELARVFKTKLGMQKLSGEDCGFKSKR